MKKESSGDRKKKQKEDYENNNYNSRPAVTVGKANGGWISEGGAEADAER